MRDASGLARVAARAWLRTASWGVGVSLRMARAVIDPQGPESLRRYMRDLLGVSDLDDRVQQLTPPPASGAPNGAVAKGEELRAHGAELLRRSADVSVEDGVHPAYARILEELAPDEARILRLLATKGPQAAVDVRAVSVIGVGSQLVAGGLNMIGREAGARHLDRVPAYLNNLERLGLIWFSREPLDDPMPYQVLEAQPEVLEAIKRTPRAKSVQRSIHLTPFGEDFCEVCLPLEASSERD